MRSDRTPYIEDAWDIYFDLVAIVYCHYLDERQVDDLVLSVARKCERDGNDWRADWFRRLVAGEKVER